jgi:tetratricopeptide (TPR) repeat protein
VKGRSELDSRTEDGMRRAIQYFRQALQRDSTFALAWSGLADAQGLRRLYGPDSLRASVPPQEKAARRALTLDPDLAEAHASIGFFHYDQQQNAPAALRHLRRSLDLKPSYAQAHHWLGYLLLGIGRPEEGLRHARRAVALNPQHVAANGVLTWAYIANGQMEKARSQVRRRQRVDPSLNAARTTEIEVLRRLGRLEEAKKVGREALSTADSTYKLAIRGELALAETAGGDTSRVRKLLQMERNLPPYGQGLLHATLGEFEAAFEAFNDVEEWGLAQMVSLRYRRPVALNAFREDSRYEKLIGNINQQWGLSPDGSIPQ